MRRFLLMLFLFITFIAKADNFERQASYTVCFTPGENCTAEIVDVINNAISNIWVQSYSFTSRPIAHALVLAKERGVNVQIIMDKQSLSDNKNIMRFFARHHIPIWIDAKPAIAHNKVMVIDETATITGSFNFTRAAQQQNAENVLIINDGGLAKKYLANWQQRQRVSQAYKTASYSTAFNDEQSNWLQKLWEWLVKWFNRLFHWRPH